MSDLLTRRRFTVEEYHRMGSAEILAKDEPVELIAGEIVVREPIGSRHAGTVNHLTHLWTWRLGERAVVQIQNPIEFLKEDSEPQPDVTLLRPRADSYRAAHPVAADVLLLVEVADGSLAVDRRVRMPLYARAGIREAWLLDLTADRVEVYRAPTADSYQHVVYHVGELVGDRRVLLTASLFSTTLSATSGVVPPAGTSRASTVPSMAWRGFTGHLRPGAGAIETTFRARAEPAQPSPGGRYRKGGKAPLRG